MAAEKKGTSRPLPSHPRPEPESPALDLHLGSPLRPLGRQASVRVQEEERERLACVSSNPTPQKEHQVANVTSHDEQPEVPKLRSR